MTREIVSFNPHRRLELPDLVEMQGSLPKEDLPVTKQIGQIKRRIYDAIYVSLAKIHETTLMAADRTLVGIVGRTDFKKHVAWLADYVR